MNLSDPKLTNRLIIIIIIILGVPFIIGLGVGAYAIFQVIYPRPAPHFMVPSQITSSHSATADAQIISIAKDGQISLNGKNYGSPESQDLSELTAALARIHQISDNEKIATRIVIHSDRNVPAKRTSLVMRAAEDAHFTDIGFQ